MLPGPVVLLAQSRLLDLLFLHVFSRGVARLTSRSDLAPSIAAHGRFLEALRFAMPFSSDHMSDIFSTFVRCCSFDCSFPSLLYSRSVTCAHTCVYHAFRYARPWSITVLLVAASGRSIVRTRLSVYNRMTDASGLGLWPEATTLRRFGQTLIDHHPSADLEARSVVAR